MLHGADLSGHDRQVLCHAFGFRAPVFGLRLSEFLKSFLGFVFKSLWSCGPLSYTSLIGTQGLTVRSPSVSRLNVRSHRVGCPC